MAWELPYAPRVRKQLEKIRDKRIIKRIEESARRLRERPYLRKRLEGYHELRSYRVGTSGGEYRIIYRLREAERVVFVILIGPRQEIHELLERKWPE